METVYYSKFNSPVGPLMVGVSERGLRFLEYGRGRIPRKSGGARTQWLLSEGKTRPYVRQLGEYFEGRRKRFSLPLDLRGTPFQRRCWRALLRIPFGKTRSYADIARTVGTRGYRAVGMANHSNPIAIVVPCHRVIASDGSLGGYGAGLAIKEKLLRLEAKPN